MGTPPIAGSRNLRLWSGSSQCILLWSGLWIQAQANLRTEIPSPCRRMHETRSSGKQSVDWLSNWVYLIFRVSEAGKMRTARQASRTRRASRNA